MTSHVHTGFVALVLGIGWMNTSAGEPVQNRSVDRTQSERAASALAEDSIQTEAAEPPDIFHREAREEKNRRYDTGGPDLTEPDATGVEQVCFCSLPLLPVKTDMTIVVGVVVGSQPFLSSDRSHVYTELTLQVEETMKGGGPNEISHEIIGDCLGGKLRLRSDQIVRDNIQQPCIGDGPRINKRYILFFERVHGGKDLLLKLGYELRNGKVYTLPSQGQDLISTLPGVSEAYSDEGYFLSVVRRRVIEDRAGRTHY